MKRWKITTKQFGASIYNYITESADGDLIRYEDYEAERSAMCEANSNAVLGEVAEVVEKYMKRHNKCCKPGFEIPDQDRLVIKSLLIDFYSRIKDGNFA